jgi:hypothetical protein
MLACKRALFQEADCSADSFLTSVAAAARHAERREVVFRSPSDDLFTSVLSPQLLLKTATHTLGNGASLGADTAAGFLGSPP